MRAAVIFQRGTPPQYVENFSDPVIRNEDELLISVKAAAVKHFDKSQASGEHYSVQNKDMNSAKIIGGDGIGLLEDGVRVYTIGFSGMIAEKAIVKKDRIVKLPENIDNATAAALPNAVMGSAMALRFRAGMQPGENLLINGATGITGKVAVQIAKHYGAKKIIVTGRNMQTFPLLKQLGAHEIVSLQQEDASFVSQLKRIHADTPIDIVIDYLWGHSAELILSALSGDGTFTHKTRFVSVGAMAGDNLRLSSSILRSTDIQIAGSGLGSWMKDEIQKLFTEILPEMFQLAADNKLKIDTVSVDLKDIEKVWTMGIADGKRLVITIE